MDSLSDGERIAQYPPVWRKREERRIFHNEEAVVKGYHQIAPFENFDTEMVRCLNCGVQKDPPKTTRHGTDDVPEPTICMPL